MLKKLLKYDFKAVLKYWWIAALVSLMLSAAGGVIIRLMSSGRNIPILIQVVAMLGLILVVISYAVFGLLSTIMVAGRFYKNFFTDEGYLTFTLPVRRGQLLNSKLIVAMVTDLMTTTVLFINIFLLFALGAEDFFPDFWEPMTEAFRELGQLLQEEGAFWWVVLYILEFVIIMALSSLFSVLFLNCCITFGCIVAKKAKIITSIAIYYAANWVYSFVLQIFFMFGISSLGNWLSGVNIDESAAYLLSAMLIFGVIAIMGLFCSLLYTLQYWMLDRKLNLA